MRKILSYEFNLDIRLCGAVFRGRDAALHRLYRCRE